MGKYKKTAFTLAEVMIVVVIISFIAITMIKSKQNENIHEKEYIAKAYKAIETVDYALSQIREGDAACPMSAFIIKNKIATSGTKYAYEKALTAADATATFNILKNYIKFEQDGLNFCTYSGYCDASSKNYPAGKISGDIYIGIELYDNIADCPNYYTPEGDSVSIRAGVDGENPKCWANLLVDVNGADGPNTQGSDVFVYGLDAKGIHY